MSQPESALGADEEGHECEPPLVWDKEQNKCVMPEVPDAHIEDKPPELQGTSIHESKSDSFGLTARIQRVVEAYFDELEKNLDKKFDAKLKKMMKEKEDEIEHALRSSLGLEKDPVVHASDLATFVRKAQLATSPTGKRTPTSPGTAGPEGNTQLMKSGKDNEIAKMFEEYGEAKP